MMVFVSGCATNTPPPVTVIDEECQWVEPIILQPGDADAISIEAARQILDHNDLVDEHCGD